MSIIQDYIAMCEWDPAKFLIVSKNVFDPLIYYSHLLPFVFLLAFGALLFFGAKKTLAPQILFGTSCLVATWLFLDLILWATEKPVYTMFFWSIINMIEPMIYAGMLYFVYAFIYKTTPPLPQKIICVLLLLPTVILTPTKLALVGFDLTNCDREAIEGPLVYYGYAVETVFVLWIIFLGLKAFLSKNKPKSEKIKIILIIAGAGFFLLSFAFGNLIGSFFVDWTIAQYGLFGIPIFIAFLSYLIVKFSIFNLRLIPAQALVAGLTLLVLSKLFTVENEASRLVTVATLFMVAVFGYFLVKSVKKEIETREKIERLADELEVANDRLRELDRQKSEFVSLASHQLRAPLTAIKGYLSMILDGDYGSINADVRDTVERTYQSANNLVTIVGDFLDVSRIEQGKMAYDWKDYDLKTTVDTVIHEMSLVAEKKGLTFETDIAPGTYMVHADPGKLKQVFTNLVDNSIKYTPKGSVKVSLIKKENGMIRFSVEDTGVGIDPVTLPRLFEKFSRAENASDVNVIGTGLGLFVAKEMIRAHAGHIWAESKGKGLGSGFYVEVKGL